MDELSAGRAVLDRFRLDFVRSGPVYFFADMRRLLAQGSVLGIRNLAARFCSARFFVF